MQNPDSKGVNSIRKTPTELNKEQQSVSNFVTVFSFLSFSGRLLIVSEIAPDSMRNGGRTRTMSPIVILINHISAAWTITHREEMNPWRLAPVADIKSRILRGITIAPHAVFREELRQC